MTQNWDPSPEEKEDENTEKEVQLLTTKKMTIEEFYEKRKSKQDPFLSFLSQKRSSNHPKSSISSSRRDTKQLEPNHKDTSNFKIPKMEKSDFVEGEEFFDFDKKPGWAFIFNNIIQNNDFNSKYISSFKNNKI